MWENVLKSKAHWNVLSRIGERFRNFCIKLGLLYEFTYPYGLGDTPNVYNPRYNGQYEYLCLYLERTLQGMARHVETSHEINVSQPATRRGEDYIYHIRLTAEDASFYLFFQCVQTEPTEEYVFHAEMSFRVPEKFWGDNEKLQDIRIELERFIEENGFTVDDFGFANNVMELLDIEEKKEEEDLHEWWGRISSEESVQEGTERERWWD